MPNKKVLIVDDDSNICELLRLYLEKDGFDTVIANDGEAAIVKYNLEEPDLILLDVMMPKLDGWQVCRTIRKSSSVPIIMLTAKGETFDKILGLDLGADDYVTKPFDSKELVARVKANISQYRRIKDTDQKTERTIEYGDISINPLTHRVYVKGREIELKNKEYELLLFFMNNIDIVFNKDQLYENVWGFDALGENSTVAVHINRLREKIEEDPGNPKYLQTVWGAGYRFKL